VKVSLQEWLERLRRAESQIYVRDLVDGGWQVVPLSTLPPDRWAFHVAGWWLRGEEPYVMVDLERRLDDDLAADLADLSQRIERRDLDP
jgi:hypothetical protein